MVSVPYVAEDMDVNIYGAIMYEIRFHHLGHIFTFTPQNNEFQLQLSPRTFASKMYGLCGKNFFVTPLFYAYKPSLLYSQDSWMLVFLGLGVRFKHWWGRRMARSLVSMCWYPHLPTSPFPVSIGTCDENRANDFMLKDGTVTTDWKALIQEWTAQQPGRLCQPVAEEPCPVSSSSHCQVLLSALFAECHKVLAPTTFYDICQQDSCHQEQVCEAIASYAHLCRNNGVCVDWRTTDFCREYL